MLPLYKNSVRTSQRTQCASIRRNNLWMLFRKISAARFEFLIAVCRWFMSSRMGRCVAGCGVPQVSTVPSAFTFSGKLLDAWRWRSYFPSNSNKLTNQTQRFYKFITWRFVSLNVFRAPPRPSSAACRSGQTTTNNAATTRLQCKTRGC